MSLSDIHRHGGGAGDGNTLKVGALEGILELVQSFAPEISTDLDYYVGRFDPSVSSGDQSYSTPGMTPKMIIIFGIGHNGYTGTTMHYFSYGFANGSEQCCFNKTGDDDYDVDNQTMENYVIYHWKGYEDGGVHKCYTRAAFKSFNTGSFTLTWETHASDCDTQTVTPGRYVYLAIG